MADIAQLGIEIDSRGAKKATGDLNTLAGAATKAEGATDRLEASADGASAANKRLGASASSAAAQVNKMAANQNSAAARMGGSFSGLAAQAQDIGVTAAMGMNPMIIGLQQGTQIAGQMQMAMQSGASAASVFGTAIRSLISPISLASIGLAALLAAGIQMVNWPMAAASALDFLANNLEAIVTYGGYAAGALALMYAPAILGGIATVTTAVWGLGAAAVGAAARFAVAWAAAAGPFTLIIGAIAAVVAAVYIFRDEIAQAIGIDIVAEAKNAGNNIIGALVGAYDAVIATWSNIPSALGDLFVQAANSVLKVVTDMVNRQIALLNKFISGISSLMKSLPGMEMFGGLNTIPDIGAPSIPNPFAGARDRNASMASEAFNAAQGVDYIGGATSLATMYIGDAKERIMGLADSIRSFGDEGEKAGRKAGGAAKKAIDQAERAAEKLRKTLADAVGELGQGIGSALKGILDGTKKIGDVLMDIGKTVLQYFNKVNVAKGGSGIFGGGLLQGVLGGLLGIGFASGGYTGNGAASKVAGVVHGGEYVFSKPAVDRIGRGNLDAMHKGRAVAPRPANSNQSQNVHVTVGVSADSSGTIAPYVESVVASSERRTNEAMSSNLKGEQARVASYNQASSLKRPVRR
ncbi:hypothetical protein [Martelella limonii]|uniref:hypothetical protein n=1 Tax=Martelella limonii TaxID=1647649 RepID=UPI00158053AF|nr:hypothetical protein [Martelella limonii]